MVNCYLQCMQRLEMLTYLTQPVLWTYGRWTNFNFISPTCRIPSKPKWAWRCGRVTFTDFFVNSQDACLKKIIFSNGQIGQIPNQ